MSADPVPAVPLPDVLAGPMLRRVAPDEVCVWFATSVPASLTVEVGRAGGDGLVEVLASGDAESVAYGPHLARARPGDGGRLPPGELLSYDVVLDTRDGAGPRRLAEVGLAGGDRGVTYGDAPLPAFTLAPPDDPLRVLHGSCRLLHGSGEDAFGHVDALFAGPAGEVAGGGAGAGLDRRPQALLLTGDQIYGDEVGGPIIAHLGALGRALLGEGDSRSVPGIEDLASVPVYGRQAISSGQAAYTSPGSSATPSWDAWPTCAALPSPGAGRSCSCPRCRRSGSSCRSGARSSWRARSGRTRSTSRPGTPTSRAWSAS